MVNNPKNMSEPIDKRKPKSGSEPVLRSNPINISERRKKWKI